MRDFRKLEVWSLGREMAKDIYALTAKFPEKEKFGFISQINRAVISIPANIAEGCARGSEKDFIRFLEISLGSAFELETFLILANDLNYINTNELEATLEKLQLLQRKLNALRSAFKAKD